MSTDSVDANATFATNESFPFPLLCDTTREVCLAYHAVRDTDGIARRISYLIDPEGRIAKAYKPVVPNEHPAQVIADLDALESSG